MTTKIFMHSPGHGIGLLFGVGRDTLKQDYLIARLWDDAEKSLSAESVRSPVGSTFGMDVWRGDKQREIGQIFWVFLLLRGCRCDEEETMILADRPSKFNFRRPSRQRAAC